VRSTPSPAFLDGLRLAVGTAHVLTADDERAPYETDWTRRFNGQASAVVRPADTDELARVLRHCFEAGIAVVPQGGNTGLVGGSVPRGGEVVVSLRRMTALGEVDVSGHQVTAGAGTTLQALQEHVGACGLSFGVDMASRGSATLGGMTATNAGGVHVVRHGPMRAQVAGFEAVLADGTVVSRMSGLRKESAGYDVGALLCGSEGTLAVLSRVLVRLVPTPHHVAVALVALDDLAGAVATVGHLRRAVPSLQAAEVFFDDGLALVREHAGLGAPFARRHPVYLLVEAAGATDPAQELATALADSPQLRDSAFAVDRNGRERLWAYRERHTEAINAAGIPHKLDVAVPLPRATEFERELRVLLAAEAPQARLVLFGHLAEGNFHVNLLGLPADDDALDRLVLGLVAKLGGTISSEHGIGVAKSPYLHLARSQGEVAAMRAIKSALDPRGILNPGVIFPAEPSR
jgi:FAD/FMN-containing dehydrogenase